jgi:hypothetical protein
MRDIERRTSAREPAGAGEALPAPT